MWNPFRRRRLSSGAVSDNFRALLALSRLEAIRLDNDFVHSAHFLLAVLADKTSSLYQRVARLPVDIAALKYLLENSVKGRRQEQRGLYVTGSLPLTQEFNSAYNYSFREAFNQGAKRVEALHVAVGILSQPLSCSAKILKDTGITEGILRNAIS